MTQPPRGITPPAPGQERQEPELRDEDDIPADDGTASPGGAGDGQPPRESDGERPLRKVERE